MEELHRVFVGGLFDSITKDELRNRFQTFGNVTDVTIVHKRDGEGNISKTFGYVNLATSTQKLNKCFAVFGGTKWKGHELKVQLAKEDFMARLEKERNEPEVQKKKKKKKHDSGPFKTYTDILETTSTMKKSIPGTPVEGERNWVIGKYGRPLPIVHIQKGGGKKTVKVDPSKFCHCLKKLPDVINGDLNVDKLTWAYDEDELNLKKKKKKKKNKDDNMDNLSLGCDTKTVDICISNKETVNDEMHSIEKKKKKKRKREIENTPNPDNTNANSGEKLFNSDMASPAIQVEETSDILEFNNEDASVESIDSSTNSEKKKKKKSKVKDVATSNPVIDSIEVSDIPDHLSSNRKRKNKNKDPDSNIDDLLEQDDNSHGMESKKQKCLDSTQWDCEEICIPETLFEEVLDESSHNESKSNVLSTSIVEQLLLRKPVFNVPIKSQHKDINISNCIQNDLDMKNESSEDSDENENLFDFEFEDIGGKNKSFLDTLVNSIEVRENNNDVNEDSDTESESDTEISRENTKVPETNNTNSEKSEVLETNNTDDSEKSEVSETNNTNESEKSEVPETNNTNESEKAEVLETNNTDDSEKSEVSETNNTNESEKSEVPETNNTDDSEKSDVSETNNTNESEKYVKNTGEDPLVNNIKQRDLKTSKPEKAETNHEKLCSTSENNCIETDKQIKKSKIANSNKQEKRALSEEKRKKSLEARNSQIVQNKGLVSKALKEVDKPGSSSNRITFSESDGEEESILTDGTSNSGGKGLWSDDEDEDENDAKEKPVEKAYKTQTNLFEDSDDDQLADKEEITIKPQFQGKEGEKLFKMQQKFGGDERFKLDERFAEEDASEEGKEDTGVEDDSANTEDLQKEKEMNISVLEEVLGKSLSCEKKEREYVQQRYDPDNVEHEKFEVKAKPSDSTEKGDDDTAVPKVKKVVSAPLPEVSKDTFFSVTESIKDLFGQGESASFSFFGNESTDEPKQDEDVEIASPAISDVNQFEEITEEKMDVDSQEKIKVPSWKKGLEDMQRFEEPLVDEIAPIETNHSAEDKTLTYLYFPDGDQRLDTGKRFIRTEELEEITNQWKAMRRTLTEDYKKKHKDAVRRVRKMRERRFNKR